MLLIRCNTVDAHSADEEMQTYCTNQKKNNLSFGTTSNSARARAPVVCIKVFFKDGIAVGY